MQGKCYDGKGKKPFLSRKPGSGGAVCGELTKEERNVFHNFLMKMKELGVIESERERGAYKFVNEIYPVFIWMESSRHRKR